MKKVIMSLLLAICLTAPMTAGALDLTDYVDPDIFWQDAELEALFNFRNGNQDQSSYNGALDVTYEMEKSTLPVKWAAYAEAGLAFSQGPNDEDDSAEDYRILGWAEGRKYLKPDQPRKWFGFGRFDLEYIDTEAIEYDDPYTRIMGGAGYGRIFTATPLMEAVRVVQDLQKYGIIKGSISDDTHMKLAKVIHKENEYKSKYSLREYEKYWYEDMEKVLRQAGVLTGPNLTAMGVIRIQDILQREHVVRRQHGWEATAGIGYVLTDADGDAGDPVLGISYKYAKPYGLKWQLVNTATFSTILPDWELGDANQELRNVLELDYEINETIDWLNFWDVSYTIVGDDGDDEIKNVLQTGLRYYINNTLDLGTYLRFSHRDQGGNDDDDLVTEFHVKLTYTIF